MRKFTAYIEKDPETGLYIGVIPQIPGAHTQAETLDELKENLHEVLELCLEELGEIEIPEFIGIETIEVS
jgi:predicted RNase H-like HicB family nuclease